MSKKLYHSGIKKPVARNTLAKANERRNWRIYADFAQVMIAETRKLYAHENTFLNDINHMAYALDSTTIDLCLQMYTTNDGKLALYGPLELEEEMYCHNLVLVPRVRIYFDDLNDFLPKPTNDNWVIPMKLRVEFC